jgi:CofH subfamily radical SAM domain protein
MIKAMHDAYPDVHLKAFTAVELDWMARKARKTIPEVMIELRDAGLGSFPGGGAEIFHPEVRDQICDTKVSGDQWIDTHRTAHKLGLRSNCTMLYGHIENYSHRVDHMRRLRELQDETGGFNVFIPLAFQPFQNEMGVNRYTFGADDLRAIAVARLYLDNFKHIKSYWVMLGQDIAQLALQFGANDLDGTVLEEKISRAAGGRAGMIMTRSNLENLIRRSGRTPVERTTLYHPVRDEDQVHLTPVDDEELASGMTDESKDMLRALKDGETMSPSNLWKVAVTTPMHSIADALRASGKTNSTGLSLTESVVIAINKTTRTESLTQDIRMLISGHDSASITRPGHAPAIVLDTSCNIQGSPLPDLATVIAAAKTASPGSSVILRGVNAVIQATESSADKPTEFLAELRALGLDVLEESVTDSVIANDAKWRMFTCAHAVEIATIPLITLKALSNAPDWSSWADDVTEIRGRLTATGLVFAVALGVEQNSMMMPSEFMKAIALTRLALPLPTQIWTPAGSMAVLAPQRGLGAQTDQHPVMKVISALKTFGSSGIGFIAAGELSAERLWEDLRASGTLPRVTCPRQNELDLAEKFAARLNELRHVPATLA